HTLMEEKHDITEVGFFDNLSLAQQTLNSDATTRTVVKKMPVDRRLEYTNYDGSKDISKHDYETRIAK
ncbi:unnamed protein product, partial [Ceratitis capitata]